MKGRIHSFQSLGTVDGPGIRCVVFMQGCPLRCICCHNPDTWDFSLGKETDTDALREKILRFLPFIGRTGGVTVSGGEPLCQAEFVGELFKKLKDNGIHTALDTSGCILNDSVRSLLDFTDLVLLDHKYATEEEYVLNTGGHLKNTIEFLEELEKRRIPTWLRRVIIPGKSDSEESIRLLAETQKKYACVQKTELLPFRKLCEEKYVSMGIPFPLFETPEPSSEQMDRLEAILNKG